MAIIWKIVKYVPRPLFSSKFRKHYLTTIYSFLFASFQLYFYYLYYFTSVSAWPHVSWCM